MSHNDSWIINDTVLRDPLIGLTAVCDVFNFTIVQRTIYVTKVVDDGQPSDYLSAVVLVILMVGGCQPNLSGS